MSREQPARHRSASESSDTPAAVAPPTYAVFPVAWRRGATNVSYVAPSTRFWRRVGRTYGHRGPGTVRHRQPGTSDLAVTTCPVALSSEYRPLCVPGTTAGGTRVYIGGVPAAKLPGRPPPRPSGPQSRAAAVPCFVAVKMPWRRRRHRRVIAAITERRRVETDPQSILYGAYNVDKTIIASRLWVIAC